LARELPYSLDSQQLLEKEVQQILREIQEASQSNSIQRKEIMIWLETTPLSSSSRTQLSSLTSFTARRDTHRLESKIQTWLGTSGVTAQKLSTKLPSYSQTEEPLMATDL